jgi:hypothetical protein
MRRTALAVLSAVLLLGLAVPAAAHPALPVGSADVTDLTHSATDNVEYHGRFPEHTGTAGGRLGEDGTRYYLTDPRGVYVYDVTTPRSPVLLGSIALYQQDVGAALAQEDPDTNGEILLVDGATTPAGVAALHVIDVSDPRNLAVLSTVPVTDHTWTCVSDRAEPVETTKSNNGKATGTGNGNGRVPGATSPAVEINTCAYAYGRTGHIVDLTDPTDAKLLPQTWRAAIGYGDRSNRPYTHDLTEIRPGLVMSAGVDAVLMDTADPTAPVRLAAVEGQDRFSSLGYHSVEWANGGRDPYVVLGTEIAPSGPTNIAGSDCEGESSVIETWDAREIVTAVDAYQRGATLEDAFAGADFRRVDTYDAAGRGIFLEGQAPGHVLYCAHWMDLHPGFDAGGKMAVSYYDRGTRFVDVAADGTMRELGWIVAAESYSGSARWITDTVVYVMDYRRGMEVVELTDAPATGVRERSPDLVALTSSIVPPSLLDSPAAGPLAVGFFVLLLLGTELRRLRDRRTRATAR